MGKIIAITNQKGGVGKTTTAVNLSAALGQLGCRVLLADLDPQGNATSGVGINKREVKVSSYHVLMEESGAAEAILPTRFKGLSILPSNIDLAGAEIELVEKENRAKSLRAALLRANFGSDPAAALRGLGELLNAYVAARSAVIRRQNLVYPINTAFEGEVRRLVERLVK